MFQESMEYQRRDGRRFRITSIATYRKDGQPQEVWFTPRVDEIVDKYDLFVVFLSPVEKSDEAIQVGIKYAGAIG